MLTKSLDITDNKQGIIILWFLSIIGSLSALPYLIYIGVLQNDFSWEKLIFLTLIQSSLLFGVVCWISYKILSKTNLNPFFIQKPLSQIVYPGVIVGLLIGIIITVFEKLIFNNSDLAKVHPPMWTRALASIYGAVNEEILLRLFLFTLIYFLVGRWVSVNAKNRSYIFWFVNIGTALVFGIGHLPAIFKLITPSAFEIFRVLFLNGIAGLSFGWLYWTNGIWTAILAHFLADLTIHVFLI